jgi:predicted RND superfamily exporter protein
VINVIIGITIAVIFALTIIIGTIKMIKSERKVKESERSNMRVNKELEFYLRGNKT